MHTQNSPPAAGPRDISGECAGMKGHDGWAGMGTLTHRGGFVLGIPPQIRATGKGEPGSSNLHTQQFRFQRTKINTNKGIIRRDIARMDGKEIASCSAREKAQILLSSRQFQGALGCCGEGLGSCPTPLLPLPWPSPGAELVDC